MKSLTLSWELGVSHRMTIHSHGLIFHQCAINISVTYHLKAYEMKVEKTALSLLLGAAKHRHHPPPPQPPYSVFLSCSFSPIHPPYIPFVLL